MKIINRSFSLFRLFVVLAPQAGGSPLIDRCNTRELEPPHRIGRGILIRLPFTGRHPTIGLVLGHWVAKRGEFTSTGMTAQAPERAP
jgi:hypothetical protein